MAGLPGVRWLRRRRNGRTFRRWARDRGLSYALRDDSWLTTYAPAFQLDVGSRHRLVDVVHGKYRGHDIACCTHRFRGHHGRNDVGVYSIALPAAVSGVRVRRRMLPALGPTRREFDELYDATGDDPQFTAAVLLPETRQRLMDSDAPGFTICRDRIFVRSDTPLDVPRLPFWLDYLETIVGRIPTQEWQRS